ncbi:connectin-like [Achroia grisella]|uniref:connectin-like n=1 Tax=Achroia grisella TaxID=688607 RepID=UPI0027D276F4|nr:connectin-like [Achroia grisella]
MAILRILTIICASWALVESKYNHHKREIKPSICEPRHNSTEKVLCYCVRNSLKPDQYRSGECYLTTEDVTQDDPSWNELSLLQNATKLTLTNTKGILLKYVPTKALEHTKSLVRLMIKYGNIEKIQAFAFSNLITLEDIVIRENNIKILEKNSFAHLKNVKVISMDTNDIVEINRDVFVDLPSIEKIFLTVNKITTIHDRAFVHLTNLKELEIDKNKLFSLNSETFSGLVNLVRLDISGNSLEVIGDNTFVYLVSLKFLNLDGNQIQMLDEKAFNGLGNLQSLSLAHNKINNIDNVKTFEGLENLKSLSLKENLIREIKADTMAPILNNFYAGKSFLDFDGNKFPCDCSLDWFLSLKNKTQNVILRNSLLNIKCLPSDTLRDKWNKDVDKEKKEEVLDVVEEPTANAEYEYYDDSQLNGTLFYIDIRYLLNCTGPDYSAMESENNQVIANKNINIKAISNPVFTTIIETTAKPTTSTEFQGTKLDLGLLDVSIIESTTKNVATVAYNDNNKNVQLSNDIIITNGEDEKKQSPTTSRLATVSAKPTEKTVFDDRDMASDEAKPDKLKAHRNYQEDLDQAKINNAQRNTGCVLWLLSLIFSFNLLF